MWQRDAQLTSSPMAARTHTLSSQRDAVEAQRQKKAAMNPLVGPAGAAEAKGTPRAGARVVPYGHRRPPTAPSGGRAQLPSQPHKHQRRGGHHQHKPILCKNGVEGGVDMTAHATPPTQQRGSAWHPQPHPRVDPSGARKRPLYVLRGRRRGVAKSGSAHKTPTGARRLRVQRQRPLPSMPQT